MVIIERFNWANIEGWFDFQEVYELALSKVTNKPAAFIEIGAWMGKSSAYMASRIRDLKLPIDFYAVDTWQGSQNELFHVKTVRRLGGSMLPTWQFYMKCCRVTDYVTPICKPSVEAAKQFKDGSVDFVMIDGDHSYSAVKSDIKAWLPKLAKDGIIAGHDINEPGVRQAVDECFPGKYRRLGISWVVGG